MRLRNREWKALFEALAELCSDSDPKTLGARSLAAAKRLVPGEITALDFFDPDGRFSGTYTAEVVSKAEYEIFANLAHTHPLIPPIFKMGVRTPMTINDVQADSEFRRSPIYNEFYRIFNISHQLVAPMQIAPEALATCTINRVDRDFSGEERLMLQLFTPHVRNAIVNCRKLERLNSVEAGLNVLARKYSGVLTTSESGSILFSSDGAPELLGDFFENSGSVGKVPAALQEWADNCVTVIGSDPLASEFTLKRSSGDSSLQITLALDGNKSERTFILEVLTSRSPNDLNPLGLTHRQNEVLFWIAKGKSDRDIAALLGISRRTVQKHVESIYARLGVETRTAAMLRARELI